jgi:hypothetical protein
MEISTEYQQIELQRARSSRTAILVLLALVALLVVYTFALNDRVARLEGALAEHVRADHDEKARVEAGDALLRQRINEIASRQVAVVGRLSHLEGRIEVRAEDSRRDKRWTPWK